MEPTTSVRTAIAREAGAATVFVLGAMFMCDAVAQSSANASSGKVARGQYLVSTSGCHDCHTPWKMGPKGPAPDMSRALSGHPQDMVLPPAPAAQGPWIVSTAATNTAFSGTWGTSFTANLTPDPETGLGKWTARNFIETIRTGRHMGRGRAVLPPMPIGVYKNFNDTDLESIFVYLQSLPAIQNRVPEPLPPVDVAAVAKN
jgi:hypothetical protein